MASRRFFGYDPYDYYYTTPYNYSYPYYHRPAARSNDGFFPDFESAEPAVAHPSSHSYYHQHHPASARAPARNEGAFFPVVESPQPVMREAVPPRPRSSTSRSVSVPVQFVGSDMKPAEAVPKKRETSPEEAAVTVQAAARGLLTRRMMREVRAVEREAGAVATKIAAEAEALRVDWRGRIGVGEELMRLLLRLDAVRGVREYRKKVTRKVLALQDAVDALEAKPAEAVTDAPAAAESLRPELPQPGEQGAQIEANITADSSAVETTAEMDMEIDGGRAEEADSVATAEEPDSAATEAIAEELVMASEQEAEAEGEWEMVTGDDALAGENPPPEAQQQGAAVEETEEKKTEAATADGLDAKKVMEMVAALCERSAQQCALIGALAERVDTLERAVRRVEEADRRRRRIKKIKEGKVARSFYSD